mmetsp:Transcript_9173/g.20274  ORF Transcript_9173/g.20274 Transcript_9173/m.20274 type:complete len:212 (-) Transcript_9173:2207-2842(-)
MLLFVLWAPVERCVACGRCRRLFDLHPRRCNGRLHHVAASTAPGGLPVGRCIALPFPGRRPLALSTIVGGTVAVGRIPCGVHRPGPGSTGSCPRCPHPRGGARGHGLLACGLPVLGDSLVAAALVPGSTGGSGAAALHSASHDLLDGPSHLVAELRRNAVEKCPCISLGALREQALKDAAKEVHGEQAAFSLLRGHPSVDSLDEQRCDAPL